MHCGHACEEAAVVMNRIKHALVSVMVAVALVFTLCTVKPAPVYANSSTETILIVLGGVIGGLMIIALIMTLIVRNNPAWMPALPQTEAARRSDPWEGRDQRWRFGWHCGLRDGVMPVVCW